LFGNSDRSGATEPVNGWVFGPDGFLVFAVAVLMLAVVFALDFWVVRTASHINGH
jgi:hypothetical protein